MPSRVSRSVSNRFSDSDAALVCGGRFSGCASMSFSRRPISRGGCWRMRSWTGKSRAFRAPAKAPSFGSSSSRPITSHTPSFTPSSRTGPSSSRWDTMKSRGSSGGSLGAGTWGSVDWETDAGSAPNMHCEAAAAWGRPSAPSLLNRSNSFFNVVSFLLLGGGERDDAASQQGGDGLGQERQHQADDGHDHGGPGPAAAPLPRLPRPSGRTLPRRWRRRRVRRRRRPSRSTPRRRLQAWLPSPRAQLP